MTGAGQDIRNVLNISYTHYCNFNNLHTYLIHLLCNTLSTFLGQDHLHFVYCFTAARGGTQSDTVTAGNSKKYLNTQKLINLQVKCSAQC